MLVSLRHDPFIIFSAKTPLRALYGRSGASQCSFFPFILAFSDCSRDAGGGTSCLCRGIPAPSLSVSPKRHSWRFKGLFFSSRLLARLFEEMLLKCLFRRFKRHSDPSLCPRLVLPYLDLASASVAMGEEKASNQLGRPFRNQRHGGFFSN